MNLLIDTHVFLWWVAGGARLPASVFEALAIPGNTVFVSAVSVWEIAIKRRAGKLSFSKPIVLAIEINGFVGLPILPAETEIAGDLDWDHRDPFDRLLVAQCLNRGLTLVTADSVLRRRTEIAQLWAG